MKHSILLFFIIFLGFGSLCLAQNPARSKQIHKQQKKHAHDHHDPYKIEWHDKDDDGDGVPNGRDKCIHTPKGEPVTPFGCPFDLDFDEVYDYEDSCKNLAGPKENHGCPWGDKDNDGFKDNVDKCPDVAGIARFHGCPDTDGDGLQDSEDRCPKERGPINLQGCPPAFIDTDKDGTDDYTDLCPTVPGPKANRGCPEIKADIKTIVQKAFDNLLFESNSDVIVSSSYPSLNELATLLVNTPKARLHLDGHTDNVGEDHFNMDLSHRRAESVKRYLQSKNAQNMITTDGFGETKPVATNDNEEGRHKNRRVEMHLINQ